MALINMDYVQDETYAYSYDGNGMRHKKKVGNNITEYYYNGTCLCLRSKKEKDTDQRLSLKKTVTDCGDRF